MSAVLPFDPRVLDGEAGWEEIELPPVYPNQGSFLHDREERREKVCVRYYRAGDPGALVGKVWFGPLCLGPPGHAHGGSLAAVLDEAMGLASWMEGHIAVAASLTVDFLRPVPLGEVARIRARITGIERRKVLTEGALEDTGGGAFSRARGLFVVVGPDRFPGLPGSQPR